MSICSTIYGNGANPSPKANVYGANTLQPNGGANTLTNNKGLSCGISNPNGNPHGASAAVT